MSSGPIGATSARDLLTKAIEERRPVKAIYDHRPRVFSPYGIGRKDDHWNCIAWQFGGKSRSDGDVTPRSAEWRCFHVRGLSDIQLLQPHEWVCGNLETIHSSCVDRLAHVVKDWR